MVRRLQLLFILSAFLSFEVFKVFGSSKSLKANEDHLRHVDHHYQLSKSRIIIDDAISISQHRSLMNYINQDPILSQGEAFTLLSDGVTINKFALRNLYEIYRSVCVDFSLSKNGVVDESHRAERVLNYTSTKKYLVTMKTIIDVQLQILAYAESFFNRTLGM